MERAEYKARVCIPHKVNADLIQQKGFVAGYKEAVNEVMRKVKALQERYGAIEPKGETQLNFKTARLIGYADVENYLEKMLSGDISDCID